MGSCGRNEEWTGGVTGADAEIGALVWVRRRNGSWWPGRILGQDELPANCVVPPRSAGTPIKLLGRPDGSIDWYNLEKSKRVKAFRCGEYEECIEKAKVLARQQKRTYNEGKYVRREDAIMHALEIEKSRFPDENMMNDSVDASQNSYSAKSKNINSLNKRSSRIARDLYDIEENSAQGLSQALSLFKQPQNISSSSTRYASSSRKKQKAAKDFQDDTVLGSQRMRDLREIGSNMVPKQKSSSGIFSNGHQAVPLLESGSSFGYDLYGTDGIKKSKETHPSTKRKRSNIGQAYENSRKKDRLRPLSKLCNDSVLTVRTYGHWDSSGQPSVQYPGHTLSNVFEPNRGKSAFSMDVNNCSNSSGTSSVETSVDASFTNHNSAIKSIEVKVAEVSCMNGFLNDDCSDGEDFFDAPLALEDDVLDEGHFCTHESYASVKGQISKPKKQAVEYSKECTPSFHDHRSSKKKSISSVNRVAQESHNRDKNLLMQQHERTAKCEALERDVAMDARAESASFCKRNGLENNMQLAIVSADGLPGVLEQEYYENAPEHDESSETISNHSHSEMGAAASPYYGMPLQVIPPEEKPDLKHAGCHVVKPIKGVCADYKIYNIQLAVQGTYKGHRVPLVSLMSKWNGKPIVGFPIPVEVLDGSRPAAIRCYPVPVEVEVLDGSRPAASTYDHHPATSSLDHLRKSSEVVEPRQARSNASRSKPSGRKKIPEHEIDKSWRPHTKKSASSPRKMRRLSSFASNRRESANRKPVIGKISGPTIACIPLRLVFSRINEALSFPVRSENPN